MKTGTVQSLTSDIELESQLAWFSTGLLTICFSFTLVLLTTTVFTHPPTLYVGIGGTIIGITMIGYTFIQATNNQLTKLTPPTLIEQSDVPPTSARHDHTPPTLKIDPDPEEWKQYADEHVSGETQTESITPPKQQ